MTRRYHVPDLSLPGGLVSLPREEAAHAIRVMRIQAGDAITLFDGRGNEAAATVASLGRNECHCDASAAVRVDREPTLAVHLGIALPKPDRAKELIERLTEMGVKSVTPLVTLRTQRPPSDSVIDKLRRAVIEACKQSGRNVLMEIRDVQSTREFFTGTTSGTRWIAHPSALTVALHEAASRSRQPGVGTEVVAAIGPEGGWTSEEVEQAIEAGFQAVDLGKRIYRIETAAVVIAAVLVS